MKLSTRKKHAVLASLVLMLGIAVLANWYYTKPDSMIGSTGNLSGEDTSNVNSNNLGDAIYVNSTDVDNEYFASAKLSRDTSYDQAVATLKEIVENSEADEQSIRTASDTIASMSEKKIAQSNIENLVKAKTGSNCVAVINDDSAEIIIDNDLLTDSIALQIKEIVMNNTKISAEKISIIGAK